MSVATRTSRNDATQAGTIPHSIAVEYVVDGPRTAAAVVAGKTTLRAIVIATPTGQVHAAYSPDGSALTLLQAPHRVYRDAVFGRAVEAKFGLLAPSDFDDVRTMLVLLGDEDSNDWQVHPDNVPELTRGMVASLDVLRARIQTAGLDYAYRHIELPVVQPTVDMICHGVGVDALILEQLIADSVRQMAGGREQLCRLSGRRINPAKATDIASYLFGELGLPVVEWTDNGNPSTSKVALRQLEGLHPAIRILQEYRWVEAVHNMATALGRERSSVSGRVHARLDPLGASTGRFTCCEPNLQGLHRGVRGAIVASPGHVLVEADVSQAEFRVLAHASRDRTLIDAFLSGGIDLHRQTMALALGKPIDQVTDAERQTGKEVNFAIIYGQTEFGLAHKLQISEAEARDFIDAFFRTRPGVRSWIDYTVEQARQADYVQTLFGRRRTLSGLSSHDPAERRGAERQAVNTIIQGTAADLLKLALVRVHRALPPDCRLLLTVHDSVLVEAPIQKAREVAGEVRRQMEIAPQGFAVPIKVDVKIGRTWGGCVPIP